MQHIYRTSEPTNTITSRTILENWKTEEWTETSTFCDSSPSQPIRGPGGSKCIMGGGRSLVAAQIHDSPLFHPAFLLRPLFSPSVEGEELALWLKGSKRPAIIIPSQMPVSPPPPPQTPPLPPGLPDPHPPTAPCTDSYISYKRQRQRLQHSLFTAWNKDF